MSASIQPLTGDWQPVANANNTSTVTITSNYCPSCQQYYYGQFHACAYYYPALPSELERLKGWLDGFTEGRALSTKQLAVVRKRITEFCGD